MDKELHIVAPDGYEIDRDNSTLERIVFKKKEVKLPESWEEFCETNNCYPGECWIDDSCNLRTMDIGGYRSPTIDANLLPSEKDARKLLALIKLIRLRDCYRQGRTPDWKSSEKKYCIARVRGFVFPCVNQTLNHVLSFQDEATRDLFLKNFKPLIELAVDLI